MKVSEVVFACWDRSCAPPPAGRGGSRKGAAHSARTRKRAEAKYRSQKVKELKKRAEAQGKPSAKKYPLGDAAPGPTEKAMKLTQKYGTRSG